MGNRNYQLIGTYETGETVELSDVYRTGTDGDKVLALYTIENAFLMFRNVERERKLRLRSVDVVDLGE